MPKDLLVGCGYNFYCVNCGWVAHLNPNKPKECPECGSHRFKKTPQNSYGQPILPHRVSEKMEHFDFQSNIETYTKDELVRAVVFLSGMLRSYDKGLRYDEILADLDKYVRVR